MHTRHWWFYDSAILHHYNHPLMIVRAVSLVGYIDIHIVAQHNKQGNMEE